MKNDHDEGAEAYQIRNDALEILNEAYRVKIEALEMLNANLKFRNEARAQVQGTTSAETKTAPAASGHPVAAAEVSGEKRGRGRPRKFAADVPAVAKVTPKPNHNGKKRGRKPKGYYDNAENVQVKPTAEAAPSGEKRGRGRPKKAEGSTASAAVAAPRAVSVPASTEGKRGRGRPKKAVDSDNGAHSAVVSAAPAKKEKASAPAPAKTGAKRGRPAKNASITRLQVPLEANLRDTLGEEGFNKATFRALTGILLCLFENGTATVSNLHEYIGGSRVTVVRHTASLKKMKLISYEGSRKKGHYALTAAGRHLHERLANA